MKSDTPKTEEVHYALVERDNTPVCSEYWAMKEHAEEMELKLIECRAWLETEKEMHGCALKNIENLMHYAKGYPDHVPLSGYALQVRDTMIKMKSDKDEIEIMWEELTKAIGAHGVESDPLTGKDTNEDIHRRAMNLIKAAN